VRENGKEKEIQALNSPIVFITSNDEKALPDAFLRRCLFYCINFPSYEQIVQIVKCRWEHLTFANIGVIEGR